MRTQVDSGFSGVVLVARNDSVLVRQAYGFAAAPLTPESPFWIASVTKSFTAAAILKLARQHNLSLTDSIFRFFPDVPRAARGITVGELLTHTAGFGRTYSGAGIHDRSAAVRAILSQPLIDEPGRGYRYGDDDYELLGAVVEVVTGRRWQEVIRRQLLEPLGLSHTGFWCDRPLHSGRPPSPSCADSVADWAHRGANGMWSTADDLLTWSRALHRGAIPELREIEVPHWTVRREGTLDVGYGYGVRLYVDNGRVVEAMHTGSGDDGNTAAVRELASGLTIVVLSNAGLHDGTTWSSYVAMKLSPRGAPRSPNHPGRDRRTSGRPRAHGRK